MRRLNVYMNEREAGVLTEMHPGRGYSFKYNREYLSLDLPPISVTLPRREEAYEADRLFPFFTNMLPEGGNRRTICRTLKIDERDSFGLLSAMADGDFIGAVEVRRSRT